MQNHMVSRCAKERIATGERFTNKLYGVISDGHGLMILQNLMFFRIQESK